jgi:hypothetical protein
VLPDFFGEEREKEDVVGVKRRKRKRREIKK